MPFGVDGTRARCQCLQTGGECAGKGLGAGVLKGCKLAAGWGGEAFASEILSSREDRPRNPGAAGSSVCRSNSRGVTWPGGCSGQHRAVLSPGWGAGTSQVPPALLPHCRASSQDQFGKMALGSCAAVWSIQPVPCSQAPSRINTCKVRRHGWGCPGQSAVHGASATAVGVWARRGQGF